MFFPVMSKSHFKYRFWLRLCLLFFLFCCRGNAETFTNSIGMEFVKIPSGSYLRGCNPNFENCMSDEKPQRRISISTFWLGKYEVTQEQ